MMQMQDIQQKNVSIILTFKNIKKLPESNAKKSSIFHSIKLNLKSKPLEPLFTKLHKTST